MPRRGLVLSTTATQMGTKVQFSCNNGNALIGTPEIACLASGNWSSPLPICESVECGEVPIPPSLNGSAPRVAIISREVGGRAAFSCPPGHGLKGPSETICLPSGEWGGPVRYILTFLWIFFIKLLFVDSNMFRSTVLPSWSTSKWLHTRNSAI